jgi:hypothetical protein
MSDKDSRAAAAAAAGDPAAGRRGDDDHDHVGRADGAGSDSADGGADGGGVDSADGSGHRAADRARAVAQAAIAAGRDHSRAGWASFQAQSIYTRLRIAVVVAWVIVSALTLALAPPRAPDFVIERRDLAFGLAHRTALHVLNEDAGDHDSCVLEVTGREIDAEDRAGPPGRWRSRPFALAQGRKKLLSTEELFDEQGRNPHYQLDVSGVRLLDDDDDVLWSGMPAAAPTGTR